MNCVTLTKNVVRISLHQPRAQESTSAVYNNTMNVTGIGDNYDEIWKYNKSFSWIQCASLVQGQCSHSAAFIGETLYISGGFVDSTKFFLNSVEAFNRVTNTCKCTAVGKLVYSIHMSGYCVPIRSSVDQIKTTTRSGMFKCRPTGTTRKKTHALLFQNQCHARVAWCELYSGRHLLFYLDGIPVRPIYLTLRQKLGKNENRARLMSFTLFDSWEGKSLCNRRWKLGKEYRLQWCM